MKLSLHDYRSKVLGCWMGKNIGGTLGAPFEWFRQVNQVEFYTQELGGDPLPNDDLDIQLLWLAALEERGVDLDAHTLAEYWTLYVTPHWAEYGTAKINLRGGLTPPLSGCVDNVFKDSCGAYIRSEIWACIAPGLPALAAQYAYQDAIIDHGGGEGVYAEVFCAALESAAFVETDFRRLIEIGLSYIPADCGVARATRAAIAAYDGGLTWLEARNAILRDYRGSSFHCLPERTSAYDHEQGFDQGVYGYDVPSNIGIVVIGLLYGEGDFGKALCTAVNCGEDTDCTGATLGSIWGLMYGIEGIPQRWQTPIGRSIKTACLNLGELGDLGKQLPGDIDDLSRRTERIARQVLLRHGQEGILAEDGAATEPATADELFAPATFARLYENFTAPVYRFDFFDVAVDAGADPFLKPGEPKTLRVRIYNRYKVQTLLDVRWYAPEDWTISPAREGTVMSLPFRRETGAANPVELTFTITAGRAPAGPNRAVIELTSPGRSTVMLVPVILRSGAL